MKTRPLFFISSLIVLGLASCGQLIDNLAEQNIVGTWNLQSIKDAKTGQESLISNVSLSTRIFGNLQGNAVEFGEIGGGFNAFYQLEGSNGIPDGTYDVDLLTLELKLNNGTTLKRSIQSIDETQLLIADTIGGVAKVLNFLKE